MKRVIAAMLVSLVVSDPAWGASFDGNLLYSYCKSKHLTAQGFCNGYIQGVGVLNGAADDRFGGLRFCLPNGVNLSQQQDVVVKWLSENPQERHHPASYVVIRALDQAFPCK
jgi:hypothetical protein